MRERDLVRQRERERQRQTERERERERQNVFMDNKNHIVRIMVGLEFVNTKNLIPYNSESFTQKDES